MAKTRSQSAPAPAAPAPGVPGTVDSTLYGFFGVFRYSRQAIVLVLSTSRRLTLCLASLTLVAGMVPAGIAWVGSQLVDAVVTAIRFGGGDAHRVLHFVVLEGVLVAVMAAAQRGLSAESVAATGAAGPARERDDPRESADPGAGPLRGFGVL